MEGNLTEAAVLADPRGPLELRSLALPAPRPGQVLVEMAYSGVCHSQLLEIRGLRGPDRFLPHTLGHEGSGIVRAVGEGVRKVRPGDRVVLSWIKGEGMEVPGTVYEGPEGRVNSGAISTFMRHTLASENRVTALGSDMPLREAALLGCAVPTGAGIVLNTLEARPAGSIAIVGAGGIGLCALLGAVLCNLSPIIVVDIHDAKLEQARALGATHAIHGGREDALDAILALTGGKGVDYAVEAAGLPSTMDLAFRAVRDGGGHCVLAGNLPFGAAMTLDPMALIRGRRLTGSWGGESRPDRDIPRFARLWSAGKLDLAALITHEFPLGEINEAFEALEQGRVGRCLIRL